MKNSIKANSACRTRQPLRVSSSPSRLSLDPPADHHTTGRCTSSVGRRSREERCSASCLATSTSPLHWPGTTLQPGPSCLTSQSEHGSDHGMHSLHTELAVCSLYKVIFSLLYYPFVFKRQSKT